MYIDANKNKACVLAHEFSFTIVHLYTKTRDSEVTELVVANPEVQRNKTIKMKRLKNMKIIYLLHCTSRPL